MSDLWQDALAAAVAQIPPDVSLTAILTLVRDMRLNIAHCILCNPTRRSDGPWDFDQLRKSVHALPTSEGDLEAYPLLPSIDPAVLTLFCEACLAIHRIPSRLASQIERGNARRVPDGD